MIFKRILVQPLLWLALGSISSSDPLTVDLTQGIPPAATCPYGPGTTENLEGHKITANQRSFFLDGTPWIPIVGEFHYARYPREDWRDELLKMKAGGVNTVSTYVFWIHHEEVQGAFDWSDNRSLRDFIKLCQDIGLKVIVRMGPWCHGEVRNGGFPDWVQHSGTNLRSKDPAFLNLVRPFFKEQAEQMSGLLWKDGGPVIGVQLDNECPSPDYLFALKNLAREVGVDVPFYTITGWQGNLPHSDLIPLFGGYSDGFWGGSLEDYRREYVFTDVRAVNDLGAQLTTQNPANAQLIDQFPYACAEIGGGMMSSYDKRIKVDPDNIASLTLSKLADGNNMPGYYMYQGGINPDGKLSILQEDHPNRMPVKDYDFQAPLSVNGQAREHYHLLREQHLFLEQFGSSLASMVPFFPDVRPASLKDFATLRWDIRSDGKNGFIFYNNQQPYQPLPEHQDVQFSIKTAAAGTALIPRQPITIPSGSYGIWPMNLDCDGVILDYATVQPLCRVMDNTDSPVYFFTELSGIRCELALSGQVPQLITPGTGSTLSVKNPSGKTVTFVVLTAEQGKEFYRVSFAGHDRGVLSKALVFADGSNLRLQAYSNPDLAFSIFPTGTPLPAGAPDGIFTHIVPLHQPDPLPVNITANLEQPAGPAATTLNGTDEKTWSDAAVYKLHIPVSAQGRKLILDIHYKGDAARLYAGDKLYDDNFYNGDAFSIALWRIPTADWPNLLLKILPYSDGLYGRLPQHARDIVNQAKKDSTLNQVTIVATDQVELELNLNN